MILLIENIKKMSADQALESIHLKALNNESTNSFILYTQIPLFASVFTDFLKYL